MITLDLVSRERTKLYSISKYLFLISLVVIFFSVIYLDSGILITILTILLLTSLILISYVKEHKEIGVISFSEDHIKVKITDSKEGIFHVSELRDINLTIDSYKKSVVMGTALNFRERSSGLGNYLKFKDKSGVNHSYEFFIETESQMKALKNYKKHIVA